MPDTLVPERVTEGAEPSVALSSRQSTAFWCGLCSPMSCLPQRLTHPPGLHVPLSLGGFRVAPPQPRGPWVALPDLGRSREPAVTGVGALLGRGGLLTCQVSLRAQPVPPRTGWCWAVPVLLFPHVLGTSVQAVLGLGHMGSGRNRGRVSG